MSSSSSTISFSLRVSSGVKTVHLLGSWDNYQGQLPLSKDKSSSKSGSWKGVFRFSNTVVEPGQRYWYYYILDGYHVSHNPSEDSTVEPTTGRALNILDAPRSSKSSKSSSSSSSSKSSSRHSRESHKSSSSSSSKNRHSLTVDIPKGRPLSVSQIKAPKPVSPGSTRHILDVDFDENELTSRFAATNLYDEYGEYADDIITDFGVVSPVSSTGSSFSRRSSSSSPNSSLSGYSTPSSDCSSCTCERYGITRKGERVRIDCGGQRCGYEESCSSSEEEEAYLHEQGSRRHGVIVRH